MKPLVFACMPSYSAGPDVRSWESLVLHSTQHCVLGFGGAAAGDPGEGSPARFASSLLTHSFNYLWTMALNLRRKYRIDYWFMNHADVEAEQGCLDTMIAECKRKKAAVISSVVAMKLPFGLTSTGLGFPNVPRDTVGFREGTRKFTMHEIMQLPETFNAADTDEPEKVLLVNTGCWIADFTQPWVEDFTFQCHDRNYRDPETGRFVPEVRGEDWNLSYFLHDRGLPYYATRKVKTRHNGEYGYTNFPAWGSWQTDQNYKALKEHLASKPNLFQDT